MFDDRYPCYGRILVITAAPATAVIPAQSGIHNVGAEHIAHSALRPNCAANQDTVGR